ncbi:type II secretion system protein GspM [Aliidiomarina celeris]|uniref:type II secretion system protein GspM n=1 Tax=Aliidiomarina celeris TaxID=2249428 RepID=UPI000DEA169C|nr:type II secretion system protein M [Aliidiomarina celeris]
MSMLKQKLSAQWARLNLAERTAPAKQRWQALEARERYLLSTLAALLAIVVLWLGVWQPLQQGVLQAERRLDAQRAALAVVQDQAQRILMARANQQEGTATVVSAAELPGYLNQLTQQLELDITRIQPQNESRVMVFNEASFDAVLAMVEQLVSRGVIIEHFDVSETGEPGIVRVRRLQVRAAT